MSWDGTERRQLPSAGQTEVHASLTRIEAALYGNGKEGIVIRLDRVEQILKQLTWFMATTSTVVIGMVVYAVVGLLKHS